MDQHVSANIEIITSKWSAFKAVSILEFEKILDYQQNNRTELGSITTQNSPPKHLQDYCKLISSVVERPEDGKLHEKSVQLSLQGQWNR